MVWHASAIWIKTTSKSLNFIFILLFFHNGRWLSGNVFFVVWQYYNCILSFIYLQMYRFELVRLLIWCSTYILISIGVLDTSSCFFHFSITCGDILHWVATNVITDICSKIDQNYIKNHFGSQISNFCQKSSKVAVGLLGYLHNQQFSLHKISFAKYNVDWFLSN